jgi:hypothetical protein
MKQLEEVGRNEDPQVIQEEEEMSIGADKKIIEFFMQTLRTANNI